MPPAQTIVSDLYRLLFGRLPTSDETALGIKFLSANKPQFDREKLVEYAQALLATNEFIFVD